MELDKIVTKLAKRTPSFLGSETFKKYAILLPLIQMEDGIHVLFEVRASSLRRQPGEICFPGGKIDPADKDEKETAVRETTEELGIQKHSIVNIAPLDFFISPFGRVIYPYVGIITTPDEINPNPGEVEEVFTVPLSFFQSNPPEIYKIQFKVEPEENFPYNDIIGGENYKWQIRGLDENFYYYEDRVIWGLTAGILKHFLEVVEKE